MSVNANNCLLASTFVFTSSLHFNGQLLKKDNHWNENTRVAKSVYCKFTSSGTEVELFQLLRFAELVSSHVPFIVLSTCSLRYTIRSNKLEDPSGVSNS